MAEITGRIDDEHDDEMLQPQAVFVGTSGPDLFLGTSADDVAQGRGGDDELHGAGGNDQLSGDQGDDRLFGEKGDDRLFGNRGNDAIEGNAGVDLLDGGLGDDQLVGGLDDDELHGGDGVDHLFGNRGDDVLNGDAGDDELAGGAGADQLDGGEGADLVEGNAGDDRLDGGLDDDELRGGLDDDELHGGDGVDRLFGSRGDDVLNGDAGDDELFGGAGADQLSGDLGDDLLDGGKGSDVLDGGAGNDTLFGKLGNDQLAGGDGDDRIDGGDGTDTLDGGVGNDTLLGVDGDDQLLGGEGEDLLDGGAGHDTLDGGLGNDTLLGVDGDDQLFGGEGEDLLDGGADHDTLDGGLGNDTLLGFDGDDQLLGGDGDDQLDGGNGNDVLDGGTGNDALIDGEGDDQLAGGEGDDFLDGKEGANLLTGGEGADRFVFSVLDGQVDRVTDLDLAVDQLDLAALLPELPEGYRLSDYVRCTSTAEGMLVAVDPSGQGESFTDVVLLEGVGGARLSGAQLGLPDDHLPIAPMIASSNAAGEAGNGVSLFASLSADGRFVTFASSATNFVAGDDATFDVFRKDVATGEIIRLSETAPDAGGDDDSFRSAISADGEIVAFGSLADDFSPVATGQSDVFVTSADAADIALVSIVNNRFAADPTISDDGTLIAFGATATGRAETGDPAPEETITERVYVRDLTDGSLTEASTNAAGEFANGASRHGEIANDGGFVVFDSVADNLLTSADTNPFADVFIKSLVDGSLRLVSGDLAGNQGFDSMLHPTVSADGRFVAFETEWAFATDDSNDTWDVYLKDMETGQIQLVSRGADGAAGDGASHGASLSADGRLIAFRSAAGNLVDDDGNGDGFDVFVKNLDTGALQRFEVLDDGDGNFDLLAPTLSADGQFVAYVDQVDAGADGALDGGQVVVAPIDPLIVSPDDVIV